MLPFEVVRLIMFVLDIYTWVIIAAAVISWVTPNPYNPVVRLLRRLTEPVLAPIRQLLPPWKTFGLDFSPMIVILLIQWVVPMLLRALMN
ncbi:MAG TPA: YggT family protein [Methylomirabilota bacterium]|nr:YggT family protein [Methylomirabilota bacterium]